MILTCPECATRYFVEDDRLGVAGRTVRCASCNTSWRAQPEEPLELVAEPEPLSFKATEKATPGELREKFSAAPDKAFRARQDQRRKMREAATAGVVWATLATGFAGMLFAAYVYRVDVVRMIPRAAGAYAMAGVPVNPTGLEFENVKATPAPDGLAAVTVTGSVRNVQDKPAFAPPLRVALVDAKGKKLSAQLVNLPAGAVAPGQVRAFSVSLPDPQAATTGVDVAFALELAPKPVPARRPALIKAHAARLAAARPHAVPAAAAPARSGAPVPAAAPVTAGPPPLRGRVGVAPAPVRPVAAVEARPLAAGDPYALDTPRAKAVSGPHG